MTFLGWMHRKLTHNSMESMKNSIIGNTCACFSVQTQFEEQNYYVEATNALSYSKTNFHKHLNRFESDEVLQGESFLEPFEFLAIGTFGMEILSTDPPTPTLPVPSENFTNHQMEITENDLKLINYELEKFIEAEEKEVVNDISGRSSQASIITLSSRPIEGADSDDQTYFTTFPLQNYLFATSTEVAETNNEIMKGKEPLEELFQTCDNATREFKGGEQQSRKRNVAYLIKKMVKKFHSSSNSSTDASKDEVALPVPMKKKLSKALKMLQKKIHPEAVIDKHIPHKHVCKLEVHDDINIVGPAARKKSEDDSEKLYLDDICEGASTIDGGRWIKTDSDYLVLEL